MSDIIWMMSVKQSLEAARFIVNTLNNDKEWSKKHENLYRSLAHELIMQYKYEKENETNNQNKSFNMERKGS